MRLNNGYSLVVSGLTANIFPASRTLRHPNNTPNLFIFAYIIYGSDKKVNSIETDRLPPERREYLCEAISARTGRRFCIASGSSRRHNSQGAAGLPAPVRCRPCRPSGRSFSGLRIRNAVKAGRARRVLPLRSLLPCGEIQLHCTGSSTAMTVPFSELFSTQTEPPWSSAISHTSDSPSPAPPYSRLRDLSTRKKGWKMLR